MDVKKIVEGYILLRRKCFETIRSNTKLLGEYEWLKSAIQEQEINIEVYGDTFWCYGYCYTTQTMSNEYFSFNIPLEEIKNDC